MGDDKVEQRYGVTNCPYAKAGLAGNIYQRCMSETGRFRTNPHCWTNRFVVMLHNDETLEATGRREHEAEGVRAYLNMDKAICRINCQAVKPTEVILIRKFDSATHINAA